MKIGEDFIVDRISDKHCFMDISGWNYPYFVLQIIKKADGSVPNKMEKAVAEIEHFLVKPFTGECTMKTQEIYSYVVTMNVNVKDAKTGQIEKVSKDILDDGTVAAYDEANAKLKVMADLGSLDEKVDIDEVEVLVRPFRG